MEAVLQLLGNAVQAALELRDAFKHNRKRCAYVLGRVEWLNQLVRVAVRRAQAPGKGPSGDVGSLQNAAIQHASEWVNQAADLVRRHGCRHALVRLVTAKSVREDLALIERMYDTVILQVRTNTFTTPARRFHVLRVRLWSPPLLALSGRLHQLFHRLPVTAFR